MTGMFAVAASPTLQAQAADHAETIAEYRARIQFYRLLAGAFVEEPSCKYLEALRSPEALKALAELGVQFEKDFLTPSLDALEQQLACEYTMLFASSGGFPAVESVRRQGGYQQDACFQARALYHKEGFEVVQGRFHIFEDQLGVELQFVAALLERCCAALERNDESEQRRLEKEIKRFWALHLGRWVRGYCALLEKVTEHSFYREMAQLLRNFAESELELLGVSVEDEDHGQLKVPRSELADLAQAGNGPVCGTCRA